MPVALATGTATSAWHCISTCHSWLRGKWKLTQVEETAAGVEDSGETGTSAQVEAAVLSAGTSAQVAVGSDQPAQSVTTASQLVTVTSSVTVTVLPGLTGVLVSGETGTEASVQVGSAEVVVSGETGASPQVAAGEATTAATRPARAKTARMLIVLGN